MLRLGLILLVVFSAPRSGHAQSCSFSVTTINFGIVDVLSGAPADATGTVNITCSGSSSGANMRICLNINAGSGGATSGIRHLRDSGNRALNYNLYQNASRTVPWGSVQQTALGNPVAVNLTLPSGGGSASTTRTIYARILAGQQTARAGLYGSTFSGTQIRFNYRTYTGSPPSCTTVTQNATRPTFTVLAAVQENCLVTAQNINFGTHGVLSAQVDATGGLGVTCSSGASYTIGLNNGLTGTGPTARRMTLGAQAVIYGLYKNAARTQPWGNSGAQLVTGTGAGTLQTLTVYGRVPAQATPPAGTYTDTVVVTVTY
jgi:spore coat protein U-like protein